MRRDTSPTAQPVQTSALCAAARAGLKASARLVLRTRWECADPSAFAALVGFLHTGPALCGGCLAVFDVACRVAVRWGAP